MKLKPTQFLDILKSLSSFLELFFWCSIVSLLEAVTVTKVGGKVTVLTAGLVL